jgi:RimJ/RimL family protein N-acetyltransferase
MINESTFLMGKEVALTPLGRGDVTAQYLDWLNDPAVLRYRAPKSFPTTLAQLETWIEKISERGDLVLAIRMKADRRHIGNIALNMIAWTHRSAELSIMIGAKDIWGAGLATDAIAVLTEHAFSSMGLHRLWSESPNPAFGKVMEKLGWSVEGKKREGFLLDGSFVDLGCWSILEQDWRSTKSRKK